MSYWTRAETELLVNISSEEPHRALITTNWKSYVSLLRDCEGFEEIKRFEPSEGGVEVQGTVDLSEYSWLFLRRSLSEGQLSEFEQEKTKLPSFTVEEIGYRPESHERETLIHAEPLNKYWLMVSTDMAHWVRRLDEHPFAVCVSEARYAGAESTEDAHTDRHRTYMLPRQLLSIRKKRREVSEEEKQRLRRQLGIS